jgi:hypothetical protein
MLWGCVHGDCQFIVSLTFPAVDAISANFDIESMKKSIGRVAQRCFCLFSLNHRGEEQ